MTKTTGKNKKLLFKAVATLIVALVFCVGSIYAWFLVNDKVSAENFEIKVIDGINIALDMEMITSNGKKVKNFRNVLPGDVLILKLAFRNFTGADLNFDLAIKQVKYAIYKGGYPYDKPNAEPDNPEFEARVLTNVSMLNVFTMQIDEVERVAEGEDKLLSTPLVETRLINLFEKDQMDSVVLTGEKILGYTSKYYNVTIKFTNDIKDALGGDITQAFLAGDKDKLNPIPIAINTFQKQNFHIGIMQVIDKGEM